MLRATRCSDLEPATGPGPPIPELGWGDLEGWGDREGWGEREGWGDLHSTGEKLLGGLSGILMELFVEDYLQGASFNWSPP